MTPQPRQTRRTSTAFACALLLLLGLAGCQPRPIDAPLETALDPGASSARRARAVTLVPSDTAFDLMPLVLSSRHPIQVRAAALDRLVNADADRFWPGLTTRIQSIHDWPMLILLADRAARDHRADAVPALVLSWSRPSTRYGDDARPERAAIASLSPDVDITHALWAVFAGDGAWEASRRTSEAAWAVLCRLGSREQLLAGLSDHRDPFGLSGMLRTAGPAIDLLPADREGLARLRAVTTQSTPEDWARRANLKQSQDVGPATLALRHLPVIDRLEPGKNQPTHTQRLDNLRQRLRRARHASRGEGDTGNSNIRSTPDRLADHADALGWADLLVLESLLDAMQNNALTASLFEQAERDRQDTTTEHGGVLTWSREGRIIAQDYAPMLRRHDQEYLASDACVAAMYTGLAHYHFHAQDYDNSIWAGPGGGDFRFADNLHAHCVVFTFIDRDTLNVDAYFPGGIVIDLGCISR